MEGVYIPDGSVTSATLKSKKKGPRAMDAKVPCWVRIYIYIYIYLDRVHEKHLPNQ